MCLGWLRHTSTSILPNESLNRNRKALEKEICLSWVIGVGWNEMAQSRNEVRIDLIKENECLEGNGKEMMTAGDFRVFLFLALGYRFSCWGCTSRCYAEVRGGHSVRNCDVPGNTVTIAPWNKSETIGAFIVRLYYRPCGSLINGIPAFDNARQIKSFIKWWRWERPGFRLQIVVKLLLLLLLLLLLHWLGGEQCSQR